MFCGIFIGFFLVRGIIIALPNFSFCFVFWARNYYNPWNFRQPKYIRQMFQTTSHKSFLNRSRREFSKNINVFICGSIWPIMWNSVTWPGALVGRVQDRTRKNSLVTNVIVFFCSLAVSIWLFSFIGCVHVIVFFCWLFPYDCFLLLCDSWLSIVIHT